MSEPAPPIFGITSIVSLSAALALLVIAYIVSLYLLPTTSSAKIRVLFIWHLFDALVHFIFEGSFLYHCFFTYDALPITSDYPHPASLTAPGVYFLGFKDRTYGAAYGVSPTAKLWQEYAKADRRWGGADLGVISLELLTVFGAGPIALFVCTLLVKGKGEEGRLWFWATVLATAELYGGFMTFAPEWLTGSPNLDTSNFMYLWVYLVFFNTLWVWFPSWVLYEAYNGVQAAFIKAAATEKTSNSKKLL